MDARRGGQARPLEALRPLTTGAAGDEEGLGPDRVARPRRSDLIDGEQPLLVLCLYAGDHFDVVLQPGAAQLRR
jgi:hypothetical protein